MSVSLGWDLASLQAKHDRVFKEFWRVSKKLDPNSDVYHVLSPERKAELEDELALLGDRLDELEGELYQHK